MNPRATYEFTIRLALTPRIARWALPVFLCLAFPVATGTADEISIDQPLTANYLPSPAGIYSQLTVAKGVSVDAEEISLATPESVSDKNGNVGLGTASFTAANPPPPQLRVAGNLKVTHCIFLRTNSRCNWDPD